jgi:pilus assembly protein Flp/PilA
MGHKTISGGFKMENVRRFLKDEEGVTAIEYGLIAAAISLTLVIVMGTLTGGLTTVFDRIALALK